MKECYPPLDPDDPQGSAALEAALAAALAPIAPDARRTSALRDRLMARASASRAAEGRLINVRREEGEWRALARGACVKTLCEGPRGRSVLVRLDPGGVLPPHRHHEHEECVVLEGEAELGAHDERIRVSRGDYHLAPAGSRHGRVRSRSGALLYLRGTPIGSGLRVARDLVAAWLPGDGARLRTTRASEGEWRDLAPGVRQKPLAGDDWSMSMLVRLQPGARLGGHAHVIDEECVMLEGEAFFGDTLLRAGDFQLAPAGSVHRDVTSDVGALLFVHGAPERALQC